MGLVLAQCGEKRKLLKCLRTRVLSMSKSRHLHTIFKTIITLQRSPKEYIFELVPVYIHFVHPARREVIHHISITWTWTILEFTFDMFIKARTQSISYIDE